MARASFRIKHCRSIRSILTIVPARINRMILSWIQGLLKKTHVCRLGDNGGMSEYILIKETNDKISAKDSGEWKKICSLYKSPFNIARYLILHRLFKQL